jgi:ParB family transcriptional regulator, chromosome partitioning protein
MSNERTPRRLGRGLEALMSARQPGQATENAERGTLKQIPLSQIRANPYQPRKEFRPEELADLESSLKATGLLQPITVRRAADGPGYELIAGERRYRAATRLGWTEIPAIVREIDDQTLLTLALVENLQRADLNPIEEAEGYQRLVDEFKLTQQQVADVVGKDRSTVANLLRLLALPASVRRMLQEGQLTLGHARALLGLQGERAITELAREVVARGLTVRDVERRVREAGAKPKAEKEAKPDRRSAEVRRIEDDLRRRFQTDVHVAVADKERGEIRISFYSADDLERVLEVLGAR